ncbi:MAG: XRE family transcriptional regulator [Paludibacteraceae bacterium]|nr:XRE family transcriptional regulator [Paludibacteraceae bacterium]
MSNKSNIHIGQLIEKEVRQQGRSIPWIAQQLNCERTNVYSIFHRESIDTALLLQISVILHHNFFSYYSSEYNSMLSK